MKVSFPKVSHSRIPKIVCMKSNTLFVLNVSCFSHNDSLYSLFVCYLLRNLLHLTLSNCFFSNLKSLFVQKQLYNPEYSKNLTQGKTSQEQHTNKLRPQYLHFLFSSLYISYFIRSSSKLDTEICQTPLLVQTCPVSIQKLGETELIFSLLSPKASLSGPDSRST